MAYEIRVKELSRVLDATAPEFTAAVARLSVLFEDLRIEEAASRVDTLSELDVIGRDYRKMYFVRRGVATLVEFGGAVKMLDESPEFREIKASFDEDAGERWRSACTFFAEQKDFLSMLRADFGGHFDHASARHAITELHPETRGVLEIIKNYSARTAGVRLKYAHELVAIAMARRKPAEQPSSQYYGEMFTIIRTGFRHAVEAMHTFSAFYLLPRFGRSVH